MKFRSDGWRFLGTFLIAFSLLSFELTTVRTINFTVGPSYIFTAIALALLGLSAAGSLVSLIDLKSIKTSRDKIFWFGCVGIAALLIFSNFLTVDVKQTLNSTIEAAGRANGFTGAVGAFFFSGLFASILIGLALSLPYFLFGCLFSYLFATSARDTYGTFYAADLIGAAFGSIVAIVFMEITNYAVSVTAPAIVALLAAAAFAASWNYRWTVAGLVGAVSLAVLASTNWYADHIEPAADPHFQVRDYGYKRNITEVWHDWNSFTRVGAVRDIDNPDAPIIMSLGNGEGMAWLIPHVTDRAQPLRHSPTVPAMLGGEPPSNALVMFAGVGADLMSLSENGAGHVTGVELNRTLVDGALAMPEFGLSRVLADTSVALEVSEGRVFLERDESRYDLILLSWSGATAAYYAGLLGGTTQYLFTSEGLASILDHLTPTGHAVILQANKVKMLAALRGYSSARGIANPERTAIILFKHTDPSRFWDRPWDNNPLLIKPSGWSVDDVRMIARNAARDGFEVAYAPGLGAHVDFEAYGRVIEAADVDAELAALGAETGQRFKVATDDRPFIFDLFDNGRYLDAEFWRIPTADTELKAHEIAHLIRVVFIAIVIVTAIILIVAPLLLKRGPTLNKRAFSHLGYFFCLGAGFIIIEIGLIQKASILFDTPSITIAVVLASLILFSGLGSLMSNRNFHRGLMFRTTALAICIYALALYFTLDWLTHSIIAWPLFAKGVVVAGLIAPGALLMGHLFPQGLVLAVVEDNKLVPWAWGINGAMSTIGAGVAPLAAQVWGSSALFLGGAALYGALLMLPTTRSVGAALKPAADVSATA
ncbi:MAG: hypothetical protein OER97_12030 [Gammaproteobacteria bacterium]|nr:hypothetical protein [Gammaproteobacteria bacterium]